MLLLEKACQAPLTPRTTNLASFILSFVKATPKGWAAPRLKELGITLPLISSQL